MANLQDYVPLIAPLASRAVGGQAAGLLLPHRTLGVLGDGIAGVAGAAAVAATFEAARINLPTSLLYDPLTSMAVDFCYGFFGGGLVLLIIGDLNGRNAA